MKFSSVVLLVQDIQRAREFYSKYFAQEIEVDQCKFVKFKSGLSLWERDAMSSAMDVALDNPVLDGRGGIALEFQSESIRQDYENLKGAGVPIVQELVIQDWHQMAFRCLDPDGHCIEVGENLTYLARRLMMDGMPIDNIQEVLQSVRRSK